MSPPAPTLASQVASFGLHDKPFLSRLQQPVFSLAFVPMEVAIIKLQQCETSIIFIVCDYVNYINIYIHICIFVNIEL